MTQAVQATGTYAGQGMVRSVTPPWRLPAWPTAIVLGVLALARPVADVVAGAHHAHLGRAGVGIVAVVSLVWVVVAASRRIAAVATLVAAGLVQATASAAMAFVLTWVFDGSPSGPLTRPVELAMTLGTGALWGLVCGTLALAFQRARSGYAWS